MGISSWAMATGAAPVETITAGATVSEGVEALLLSWGVVGTGRGGRSSAGGT